MIKMKHFATPNRLSTMTTQSRVRFTYTNETLSSLVTQYDNDELKIPEHQREYCWISPKPERFIESIMRGYPCPAVITCQSRTDPMPTLEDGRQRITTASNFKKNLFTYAGKFYKDLTEREQDWFDNYQMMVIKYANATHEDRIQIFDWFQNGVQLSGGERYHAHSASFLIKYVKDTLFTPGMGLHDRAIPIWGARNGNDKRRKWLQSAVGLVVGLAHGMTHMTKKYDYISETHKFLTKEFDRDAVTLDLERILEIFEEADTIQKVTGWKNTHWDAGNFVGYIAYSLSHKARFHHQFDSPIKFDDGVHKPNSIARFPGEWERLKTGWVTYICKVRRACASMSLRDALSSGLHDKRSAARFWELSRWRNGYLRVFEPNSILEAVSADGGTTDDSDA